MELTKVCFTSHVMMIALNLKKRAFHAAKLTDAVVPCSRKLSDNVQHIPDNKEGHHSECNAGSSGNKGGTQVEAKATKFNDNDG